MCVIRPGGRVQVAQGFGGEQGDAAAEAAALVFVEDVDFGGWGAVGGCDAASFREGGLEVGYGTGGFVGGCVGGWLWEKGQHVWPDSEDRNVLGNLLSTFTTG